MVLLASIAPTAAFTTLSDVNRGMLPVYNIESPLFQETLMLISNPTFKPGMVLVQETSGDAIDEILQTLDGNSEYLPHNEAADFEIETEQRYGGIGVEVEWVDDLVTIVSPFEDSPGELAGLHPGDQIVTIEGVSMTGKTFREVVDLLRGPPGSNIHFAVFRPSSQVLLEKEVIRQVIKVESVRGVKMLEPGIGYIRITQFGTQTYEEFVSVLQGLEKEGLEGLILDLRNNPGGVLSAAVDIAGEFFEKGEVVVYTKGKNLSEDKQYTSRSPVRKGDYSIVVLVNGGSASASEIVAGALQDIGRAQLVGTKTFGKGTVQTIFKYQSGDAMRRTTALFFTPGGRVIHRQGIEPDVIVLLEEIDRRKLMLQRRYLMSMGAEGFTQKYGFVPVEDEQLNVALKVVRERVPVRKLH
jgi:carboxyl-terminal processing protease